MKYCALIVLACGVASAADFVTGQAARAVIGQTTFTAGDDGTNKQATVGATGGIAISNGTLFVADSNKIGATPANNRVLIFNGAFPGKTDPTQEILTGGRCPVCGGTPNLVLGQPDLTTTTFAVTSQGMRSPTDVATDGTHLAVADTDNNRILIWNSIPLSNDQPADFVVGQPDFKSGASNSGNGLTPNQKGLRGPQGVWLWNNKLFVADTMNNRVLIWNSIPSANNTPADIVIGQPNFTTFVQADLTQSTVIATASNLLSPTSVSTDGTHLIVADLGQNRVLIWNTVPTSNGAPADVDIGQPALASTSTVPAALPNNVQFGMCPTQGTDSNNNLIYPPRCAATLNFPRYAISDGKRLYISDSGNNRILIFNTIPTQSAQRADAILGAPDDLTDTDTDTTAVSAADAFRSPTGLAWDGTNLYVSDTYNRRIVVFTPGEPLITRTAIRNAASEEVFDINTVSFAGSINPGDTVTLTIGTIDASGNLTATTDYKYTIVKDDTLAKVAATLAAQMNSSNNGAGDPLVLARANPDFNAIVLTARKAGSAGDSIGIGTTLSTGAQIQVATQGRQLFGSQDPAKMAPGTLMEIFGTNLTDQTAIADLSQPNLPLTLGGVQVYIDGTLAPLLYVSPTQINAQMPFGISDASSVSAYIRYVDQAGNVHVSSNIGVPIQGENPGIFALAGSDPRTAIAVHTNTAAAGLVGVDGTITAGDKGTITINGTDYSYTVQSGDTLAKVRDALIAAINADANAPVTATAGGAFTRVVLLAKSTGTDGNAITYKAATTGSALALSAYGSNLCCANQAGAPITADNPAVAGEVITIYATGLGLLTDMTTANTGGVYTGPISNTVTAPIDALVGGQTAQIVNASLAPGTIGVYRVDMMLSSTTPANPQTQVIIAQELFLSNIVTIAVVSPPAAQ